MAKAKEMEIENMEEMSDEEAAMDFVDEPATPKEEGKIKRLVRKLKPAAKAGAKEACKLTIYGAVAGTVATAASIGWCKLTGKEIVTLPEGGKDVLHGICGDIAERLHEIEVADKAAEVVEKIK